MKTLFLNRAKFEPFQAYIFLSLLVVELPLLLDTTAHAQFLSESEQGFPEEEDPISLDYLEGPPAPGEDTAPGPILAVCASTQVTCPDTFEIKETTICVGCPIPVDLDFCASVALEYLSKEKYDQCTIAAA